MEKVKAWLYVPLLGLLNILSGYLITKFLDSLVGNEANSISEISISSVHWLQYIPAILVAVLASIFLFYICKNLSNKDQSISINVHKTRIVTGEKAHVAVSNYGKIGNKYEEIVYKNRIAPKNMTISYGLKFELPESSAFSIIPNLRVITTIAGYKDTFSISNRPLKNIVGH